MTPTRFCPECQAPLPTDAPAGLCPRCLLQRGLGSDTSGTTAGYASFAAPSVGELVPLFPQLEIIELVGQGGMGAVYKARQPGLDRLVALKILPRRDDAAFAERFTREARALARLSHPGIVTVHDFGQADGLYYFVMEFVEGVNLRQAERAGTLTPAEALAIVPQICAALQFAHDAGVVHRDIKPENILLDAKGRVKIADFGLAKLRGSDGPNPLTHTNQVMGTIHYMAPEQWEKPAAVDHRADIYSLGVVFYELLTGELPLGRFPLPSEKVQIDVRLDDVVLRTLEKEPDRRYQHASDVKTDVERVTSELVDRLSLDEVDAALKVVPQRMKELKATQQRLWRRQFDLWRDEYRRKHPEKFQPWSRRKRVTVATLCVIVLLLIYASIIVAAFNNINGLSVANFDLVFAIVLSLLYADGALTWRFPKWKATADPGPIGKIGCWIALVAAVTVLVLQIWGNITKNPAVQMAANSALLALGVVPFLWQLPGRLIRLSRTEAPPAVTAKVDSAAAADPGLLRVGLMFLAIAVLVAPITAIALLRIDEPTILGVALMALQVVIIFWFVEWAWGVVTKTLARVRQLVPMRLDFWAIFLCALSCILIWPFYYEPLHALGLSPRFVYRARGFWGIMIPSIITGLVLIITGGVISHRGFQGVLMLLGGVAQIGATLWIEPSAPIYTNTWLVLVLGACLGLLGAWQLRRHLAAADAP